MSYLCTTKSFPKRTTFQTEETKKFSKTDNFSTDNNPKR